MAGSVDFKRVLDPLGLFTKPEDPKVIPYPKASTADPAAVAAQDAASLDAARRAATGGRASTQLTGSLGTDDASTKSAAKRLLGE